MPTQGTIINKYTLTSSTYDKTYHHLPCKNKEPERHAAWIKAIRRDAFEVQEHTRVCGKHFPLGAFKVAGGKMLLREDAVPSVFPSWPSHLTPLPTKKKRDPPRERCTLAGPARLNVSGDDHCDRNSQGNDAALAIESGDEVPLTYMMTLIRRTTLFFQVRWIMNCTSNPLIPRGPVFSGECVS